MASTVPAYRLLGLALPALSVLAAAAPIGNILYIVATTGSNSPSNDYMAYVVTGFLDQIATGTYRWRSYFADTFVVGSHCMAIPVLIRVALIRCTEWNLYGELYCTVGMTFARLVFLYSVFTTGTASRARWVLLPVLSGLSFAVTQIDAFTYGDAGLQISATQLGLALSVYGLARRPDRLTGAVIVALGGVIASWSSGAGLAVWPVTLCGMALLGHRRPAQYGAWLAGAVLSAWPYALYMNTGGHRQFLNLRIVLEGLGMPLAYAHGAMEPEASRAKGATVLVLLVLGLVFALRRWSRISRPASASLAVAAVGLVNGWQISIVRAQLAPWYASTFLLPWVGLAGLAYAVWAAYAPTDGRRGLSRDRWSVTALVWAGFVPVLVVVLYMRTNLRYEDKVMYLYSRSPASASCLRNYERAPTYCEEYVFQWGVGFPENLPLLGQALERNHLSVFSSRQEWALQGDFVLDTVRLEEDPRVAPVRWTDDLSFQSHLSFRHYRHLNLFLQTPNAVYWTITLPANTTVAELRSAVAISESAPLGGEGVRFEVDILQEGRPQKRVFSRHVSPADRRHWQPFAVPLTHYAGLPITIRFGSSYGETPNGGPFRARPRRRGWAMYRYPRIDLSVNHSIPVARKEPVRALPEPGPSDLPLDPKDPALWEATDLVPLPAGPPGAWLASGQPVLRYKPSLSACLADYSLLYVKLAVPAAIQPRAMRVWFDLEDGTTWRDITLHPDSDPHVYRFDLKLLERSPVRLTGLRLAPVIRVGGAGTHEIRLDAVWLLRKGPQGYCAS